nr:MAG TPA: hypothetical protein [Caudoviricetes sp.]
MIGQLFEYKRFPYQEYQQKQFSSQLNWMCNELLCHQK